MAPRVIMRIDLLPAARQKFTHVPEIFGMTQAAVNTRLVEWIVSQPEEVQASILGLMPSEATRDAAKDFLKRMAKE
jgi:hypothetical protein